MNTVEMKRRVDNAKALDFGTIFNQSIELFKKVWVQGVVILLLNMVLTIPVIMIVYIPLLVFGFAGYFLSADPYGQAGLSIIMIFVMVVVYLFLIVALSAINLGLTAGYYRICKLKDLDRMGNEDYFYFFKKPYLRKTIKLGLAFSGIALLAALLCFFPIIYAIVPLSFIVVIYAFNPDSSISEIIKLGFDLGNKKWFLAFAVLFVLGVLAYIVGLVMCGIGVLITMSITYLPFYIIYKDVIGFDEEIDQMKRIDQLSTD